MNHFTISTGSLAGTITASTGSYSISSTSASPFYIHSNRRKYICEHHGVIGEDTAWSFGAPVIYSNLSGYEGEIRCQRCYWENVIVPNCGKVTIETEPLDPDTALK